MKKYLFFFCCLLTAMVGIETMAQSSDVFKNIQVKAKFQVSPVYQVNNYSNANQSGCEWLVLNITYFTPKTTDPWLDDVSVEAEILFPAEYQGKSVMAQITGKTTYWSVEMNGKTHQEIMAVPPDIFRRYTRGSSISKIQIAGRLIFYSKSRAVLGGAYFEFNQRIGNKDIAGLFAKYNSPVSNSLKVENMILSRDKSPWANIQFDFYDLIKPEIKR
ncbi:MAG: hypothetical protein ACYC4Q_06260 [Victivallaceae bacterium]